MTDSLQLEHSLAPWITKSPPAFPGNLPVRFACTPADAGQLQQVIRYATAQQAPIYPIGGQTALHLGRTPTAQGVALMTSALDRLIDYPARDMTVTIQAGLTVQRLNQLLAQENQCLPIDVPDPDRATVGGIVATNTSSARRFGYGTLRDYVIGVSAVDAAGTLFKAGGRVVKNVAGYDLCKLLIGSFGTLAVITELTLKVRPRPEADAMIWALCGDDPSTADTLLDRLVGSASRPVCIELLNPLAAQELLRRAQCDLPANEHVLLVGFEGGHKAVAWQCKTLLDEISSTAARSRAIEDAQRDRLWQSLRAPLPAETGLTFKANLPPSRVCEFFTRCDGRHFALHSHAGNGIVMGSLAELTGGSAAEALLEPLRNFAVQCGGNLIVTRCPDDCKQHIPIWGHPRDDWKLMQRIKNKLDPQNLLNPGRFIDCFD